MYHDIWEWISTFKFSQSWYGHLDYNQYRISIKYKIMNPPCISIWSSHSTPPLPRHPSKLCTLWRFTEEWREKMNINPVGFFIAGRTQTCAISHQGAGGSNAWDLKQMWHFRKDIWSPLSFQNSWAHSHGSSEIFHTTQDTLWGHQNNQREK